MATNKQAAIRYKVLDMCLANTHRKYTLDDLLEACNERLAEINPSHGGISVRTLRDDLKYTRSVEGWINELIPTLTQTFLLEKKTLPIIGFDTNQYLQGREHIGSLSHHILYKRALAFTYHPFSSEVPVQMIIHPYYLRQYNNRWFLFRWNDELQRISTLALDRIVNMEESKETIFIENTCFDPVDYFEDIIGVSRIEGQTLQRIGLFFTAKSAPYILSKPLHGSQRIVSKPEEGVTISIDVIPNFELETVILSHGERVKVMQQR